MAESYLKKEFQKSDVARLRNLVTGNYSNSTKSVVGYTAKEEQHKEGDTWEDAEGGVWVIKNGLRSKVSKLQTARQYARLPLTCPKCGKPLNTRLDRKIYPIQGVCYDCVVKMEDDLKRAGLYAEYEKAILSQNIKGFISELEAYISSLTGKTEIVTEDGTVENWGKLSKHTISSLQEWSSILSKKL